MIEWVRDLLQPSVPSPVSIFDALNRNGSIIRLAQIQGRSLTYEERAIILAVRKVARDNGLSESTIVLEEFKGIQDRDTVYKRPNVHLRFAYWTSPEFGRSAIASYTVIRSNHPVLLVGQTVDESELLKLQIAIPSTPSYERWVKRGRKLFLPFLK